MSQAPYERVAMGLHFLNPPLVLAEIPQTADRIVGAVRDQLEVGSQPVNLLALAKAITDGRVELVVDLEALDSIDTEDVGCSSARVLSCALAASTLSSEPPVLGRSLLLCATESARPC
jgi:hypothetical protein